MARRPRGCRCLVRGMRRCCSGCCVSCASPARSSATRTSPPSRSSTARASDRPIPTSPASPGCAGRTRCRRERGWIAPGPVEAGISGLRVQSAGGYWVACSAAGTWPNAGASAPAPASDPQARGPPGPPGVDGDHHPWRHERFLLDSDYRRDAPGGGGSPSARGSAPAHCLGRTGGARYRRVAHVRARLHELGDAPAEPPRPALASDVACSPCGAAAARPAVPSAGLVQWLSEPARRAPHAAAPGRRDG